MSLKEAREKRDEARKALDDGQDPSQLKMQKKLTAYITSNNSFEIITREWHENRKGAWTEGHAANVLRRLELDIFPTLGFKAIQDIKAPELLAVLKKIEERGAIDIAHRALQTTGQIFRYAVATGKAERDISSDLRGALKTRKKENHAHLEEKELPEFLSKLETDHGSLQTILAFKLLILTFVRTGELRKARWEEIDFEKREWRIPAERMKMREPHIVPLSTQAITILKELEPISGSKEHIFPNRNNPMTYISENTFLRTIKRMGYHKRTTGHGFRATASTVLNEHSFPSDIIELQLAHSERDKVRASYNHAKRLPERRTMMQWWADYLGSLVRDDNVTVVNFQQTA